MLKQDGLTRQQVEKRIKSGLINKSPGRYTKSTQRIIFDNVFTYFNILTVSVFVIVMLTGLWENGLFIGVVFSNAFTGIVQELKAKKLIDKLAIVTAAESTLIRDGEKITIKSDEIVKDDVIIIDTGTQMSVDGEVLSSSGLEMDESLLTGESKPVRKKEGDMLFSGSFVSSGSAVVKAVNVGGDSYASRLAAETKKPKKANSEIIKAIKKIIRWMSYIIVPVGIVLFISQYYYGGVECGEAVIGAAGAVIGMIPSGLVLISTITLALGVYRCARHNALVQEAAAIEVLARVDTLCIDKTGTLTDGGMELYKIIPANGETKQIKKIFSELFSSFEYKNATAEAVLASLGVSNEYKVVSQTPFSSQRKWCAAEFEGKGSYVAGAPEFVMKSTEGCEKYLRQGYRVIVLAHSCEPLKENLPDGLTPVAYAVLADRIKPDAAEVLRRFAENDVDVKIISGDNPITVSSIAQRLNLPGAEKYVDMSQYGEDDTEIDEIAGKYQIFGRVSPRQKKNLVSALKKSGKTVAMTGDGVNDVLALREADCSVAMANGSDAAKGVAKIVLVNSDFSPLIDVVGEGRRVVNNLELVSSLYLTKTIFSLILSLFFIFWKEKYPLDPIFLTLIGSVAAGIPSFFLAMENNTARIKKGFQKRMYTNALPGSIVISLIIIGLSVAKHFGVISEATYILQSVWITGFVSLTVLYGVSKPLNRFRSAVVLSMWILFVAALALFGGFMGLAPAKPIDFIIMAALSAAGFIATLAGMRYKRKEGNYGE